MGVLITGVNGGIGKALCKQYTSKGVRVYGLDLGETCNHEFVDEYYKIDLNGVSKNEKYREQCFQLLSKLDIDTLINNAACQLLGDIDTFDASDWEQTLNVNLSAPFYLVQGCLVSLEKNNGVVVNVGSIHAGLTKPGFFAYATSKAALVGLTKALAVELKGRVRVNAISPAAVNTEMLQAGFGGNMDKINALGRLHPSQKIAEPNELAEFIFELSKSKFPFLNGSNISYDGGISSALLDVDV